MSPKIFWVAEDMSPNIFGSKSIFWTNFGSEKKIGSKRFWVKRFLSQGKMLNGQLSLGKLSPELSIAKFVCFLARQQVAEKFGVVWVVEHVATMSNLNPS